MPKIQGLSLYKQFADKWGQGCGSPLCSKANKIVLAKGKVPCDILFVGEASGESENVIGVPFCGPAGMLLEHDIIRKALPGKYVTVEVPGGKSKREWYCNYRLAWANLVCCIPREEDGAKTIEPSNDDIESCKPRLEEFIEIAQPKLIVCVGKLSSSWFEQGFSHSVVIPDGTELCEIVHPAAVLRSNISQRGLMVQRCIITIRNRIEEVFPQANGG